MLFPSIPHCYPLFNSRASALATSLAHPTHSDA
jgi:hypothetical protein